MYLGSIVNNDGEITKNVTHKVQVGWVKWWNASGVLFDASTLEVEGKILLYHYRPAMLYGIKCWVLRNNMQVIFFFSCNENVKRDAW